MTPPRRELTTAQRLASWAFDVRLFRIKQLVAVRGRVVERLTAAWPGYLFVDDRFTTPYGDFLKNFVRFVVIDNRIVTVRDDDMIGLMMMAPDCVLPPPIEVPRFTVGDEVVIRGGGPFDGQRGVFQRMIGAKAVVDLPWIDRAVPTIVDEADLDVVERKATSRKKRRRTRRARHSSRLRGSDRVTECVA